MGVRRHAVGLLAATLVSLQGVTLAAFSAEPIKTSACLECHADKSLVKTNALGRAVSLYVDAARLFWSVHSTNSCVSCHDDITSQHPDDGVLGKPVECGVCHELQTTSYNASVHGLALKASRAKSPRCKDCHGYHEVLPGTSRSSRLHFSQQAETCGGCHAQAERDWSLSVHGTALAIGVRDAPTCTDCHSEHKIEALSVGASRKISERVCGRCHGSERISTKFNLPADRAKTFFESYHGLASKYGSTVAADCGSCHGYHKVLPSSDPASTIHPDRLVETCGKCHPGANEKFAAGKIHIDLAANASGSDIGDRVNWWVRQFYLLLIFGVIGAMLVHNGLAFFKKVAAHLHSMGRPVLRMTRSQRWQHALLALSFVVLAISGFALRFPDSWLARMMGSSEPIRRWMHRIAGVALLVIGAYHLVYVLATKEGRKLVKDLFPIKKDLADIGCAGRHLLGLSQEKPRFSRFGYVEKVEYWAVVWGTIIMGVTGLMIWFKIDVTKVLPRWGVDVATTVHYYEAILACLAIMVWHLYHVMFDPDVYPLNPSCWDGRVSEQWQQNEHPLDYPPLAGPAAAAAQNRPAEATPRHHLPENLRSSEEPATARDV